MLEAPNLISILGPCGPIPALSSGDPRTCKAGIVLGYGLRGKMEVQWPEAKRLLASGYAVIVPEAPHHGLRADGLIDRMSGMPESEARACFLDILETWAAEIPVLVDHLAGKGATKIVIAGVSMGGHWALAAPMLDSRVGAVVSFLGDPAWDNRSRSPHLAVEAWSDTALLAITTNQDEIVPPEPMRIFVDQLNASFPAMAPHLSLCYPGGHCMASNDWEHSWSQVIAWLDGLR